MHEETKFLVVIEKTRMREGINIAALNFNPNYIYKF